MALDRQAIEKRDFPISRRGYEPEAVDAHLASVAAELEQLQAQLAQAQRGASAPPVPGVQSLAVAASEQVRLIVEAAEVSATEIERSAEEQAARIRADADSEARELRDEAVQRSEEHVGRVGEVTTSMLHRVDAMEQELSGLFEGLRTGAHRLTGDLSLLHSSLGDLHGVAASTGLPVTQAASASSPPPAAVEPTPAEPAPVAVPEPEPAQPAVEPEPEQTAVTPAPAPAALPTAASHSGSVVAESAPAPVDSDVDGARLIALNMALNGQSRAETDQYLHENFALSDRGTLLDEVYATVEG